MLCVLIFIYKWRDLQFKVDSEPQIFWETSHDNFFTHRVFARNLLRGNYRRNTFCILFWCLVWGSNPGFTSNKPTHYLLTKLVIKSRRLDCYWSELQLLDHASWSWKNFVAALCSTRTQLHSSWRWNPWEAFDTMHVKR